MPCIRHSTPFRDAAGRQRFDAELLEHVQALGAVVHAVRRHVSQHGSASKLKYLAVALTCDHFIQWPAASFGH